MPITRIANGSHYLKPDSGLDALIHPPQVRRLRVRGQRGLTSHALTLRCNAIQLRPSDGLSLHGACPGMGANARTSPRPSRGLTGASMGRLRCASINHRPAVTPARCSCACSTITSASPRLWQERCRVRVIPAACSTRNSIWSGSGCTPSRAGLRTATTPLVYGSAPPNGTQPLQHPTNQTRTPPTGE